MSKGYKVKQVLVVRKDLQMRQGKTAAQCAHASLGVFTKNATVADGKMTVMGITKPMAEWLDGSFAKIVVYVRSEEELLALHARAEALGLPTCLVTDSGNTEFHGVPTKTVLAIGPALSDTIDSITKSLPLL